jgi:Flp pilus assembly protein CpaB
MATPISSPPSPILAWDKSKPQLKNPAKKSSPLTTFALLAIVILGASGFWRMWHSTPTQVMVKVLTTFHDIPPGTKINFMSVHYMDIPKRLATSDMLTSLNEINGRMARAFLPANAPITTEMMFPNGRGITGMLENDERAITLQLKDDALVDHTIQPDDRVDVLAITTKDGQKYTKTICQSIRVLMAVPKEQALNHHDGPADAITLAVIPAVGEMITEAMEVGKVRLILRNRLTRVTQKLAGATPNDLVPASAIQVKKEVTATLITQNSGMSLPPPPSLAKMELPNIPPVEDTYPAKWLVEMLSGNHKELVDVPPR